MRIAVLYQAGRPPAVDGIEKPMKKGGYSDSGADIAYCLRENRYDAVTPAAAPDVYRDLDWVFPDTEEGIRQAIALGADTFWLNTVLYAAHPITRFKGVWIIGQDPAFTDRYDDKYAVNHLLLDSGLSVADSRIVSRADCAADAFPCVIKPIRGRGSQGVKVCDTMEEVRAHIAALLRDGHYGDRFMCEPFLDGREITVGVFPDGTALPPVIRIKHADRIMPYNGKVPVTENSYAAAPDPAMADIIADCGRAARLLHPKAMIRIDCREKDGKYYLFDVNPKPNMTGAVRPHRMDQDSLLMIAMKAEGKTYADLIERFISFRWRME